MTPKEKAQELLNKYDFVYIENYSSMHEVKQCALIAVDEIIDSSPMLPNNVDWDECGASHMYYYPAQKEESLKYWQQVKQELENL